LGALRRRKGGAFHSRPQHPLEHKPLNRSHLCPTSPAPPAPRLSFYAPSTPPPPAPNSSTGSPAILRKWLRKPAFRAALAPLRDTLQFQSDFHISNAATTAARKLLNDDADLTTHDLGRLLRLAHLRQRFAHTDDNPHSPNSNAPSHANNRADDDDDEDDDDPAFAGITAVAASKANPANKFMTPGCMGCLIRQRNPDWVEDPERFKKLAFQNGYTSPLRDWPDFPPPVPQDTFYYPLLQHPAALLRYMQCYDRAGNDHRFQPILMSCQHLLSHHEADLPRFPHEHPQPPPNES
jgi:hypothetical protein